MKELENHIEADNLTKEISSDSDMGLPPSIPPTKPKFSLGFVPSLKIGGLGMSTLAVDGANGKTAEQMADM